MESCFPSQEKNSGSLPGGHRSSSLLFNSSSEMVKEHRTFRFLESLKGPREKCQQQRCQINDVYEVFLIVTLNAERFLYVLAVFSEVTAAAKLSCLWIEHFHRFHQPCLAICNNTSEIYHTTVHLWKLRFSQVAVCTVGTAHMNESRSNKGWRVPFPTIFENQTSVSNRDDIKFVQV